MPLAPVARRDLAPRGVAQDDPDLEAVGVGGRHRVVHRTHGAGEAGDDRDVLDAGLGCGGEPDRAVDAGEVEEVVPVALGPAARRVLDDTRWDRLEAQRVVDERRDAHLLARRDELRDVGLERACSHPRD